MEKYSGRVSALAVAVGLILAGNAHADVVISQVYGGGGNSGAPLRSDFIELHNNGSQAVDLAGWSVQYASAAGTTWQRTNLSGSVAPGGYYLIQQANGSNTSAPALPSPDATGTIAMAGTAGKVALVASTTLLSGACPTGNVDFVGFGSTASCAEGSAPTANLTNATAALRAEDGCTDSNNNAADFATGAPVPRNAAAPARSCSGGSLPVLTVADVSALENADAAAFTFRLQLNQPAGPGGVTVEVATADGSARAGQDYLALAPTVVTIAEGSDHADVVVSVINDGATEADESFVLNLANVRGAVLGNAQAQATIVNDDVSLTPIHDIQGNGAASPLVGQRVVTEGIVTGRKGNGFFLQSSNGEADTDPATSEGVFVFTTSAPNSAVALGNRVRVSGTVVEFVPPSDPGQAPLTEIGGSPTVTLVSPADPALPPMFALPTPVELTTGFPDPAGALDQLERVEGMRVLIRDATVVAPTQGNTSEPNASGSSNGILSVVVTGVPRPFREPGIPAPDAAPDGAAIPPIPRWDFNPELLTVDSDALGGQRWDVPAGARIGYLAGPLDYGFRRYTVLPDQLLGNTIALPPESAPRPAPALADPAAFTVAGYNLERFFDTINDPAVGEPVLTAAAFERRLAKASLGIRRFLNTPDILGTVEVENLAVLQTLAARVNADAVAAGQPDPRYVAYLVEGNDVGGIDVGFLVKTADVQAGVARVEVVSVTQVGKDTTWQEPSGDSSLLNDRPPLALDAVVHYADGRVFPLGVVLVHQRSLNGAEDNDAGGDRVRRKRQHQAEFLAGYLQQRQTDAPGTPLVVLGDFNAFEFNDGLVDAMNVVTGTPSADAATVVPGDGIDLVEPNLVNLGELAPAHERYSFVFGGNAQTLDHVLVNEELVVQTSHASLDHARINADFPEINRNDASSPSRLSDHDPVVATFVPRDHADLGVAATADATSVVPGEAVAYTATLTNLGPQAATFPGIGFAVDAELPDLAVTPSSAAWNCDAARVEAGRTSIACNAATLAHGETVRFAVTALASQAHIGRTLQLAVASDAQSLDNAPGNDQASADVTVQARADLSVQLGGPAMHLRSGTVGRFPLTVHNAGPDAAARTRVRLYGDAPAGNVQVQSPQGWECAVIADGAGFAAQCDTAALARDGSQTFVFAVKAPPRVGHDLLTLTTTAESAARDAAQANNSAVHAVRVIGSPH